jgi:hypothetical protein
MKNQKKYTAIKKIFKMKRSDVLPFCNNRINDP